MINYFKATEQLLSHRGDLEIALANLERRLERALKANSPGGISSTDYTQPYVSASGSADALSACIEVAELTKLIKLTKETTCEIDRVLDQLAPDDATLLREWHIERTPKADIADKLSYSSRTSVYHLHNKALAAFAVLYYGAASLSSI